MQNIVLACVRACVCVRCSPEVAARVYDPASGGFLPQLLLGQRPAVTEQLGGEAVVGRLKQGTDLFLDEPGACVAVGRRLWERSTAASAVETGGRLGSRVAGRWRPQLWDGRRPRRDVLVHIDDDVRQLLATQAVQQHRTTCHVRPHNTVRPDCHRHLTSSSLYEISMAMPILSWILDHPQFFTTTITIITTLCPNEKWFRRTSPITALN